MIGSNIRVVESKDQQISYAILNKANSKRKGFDTIYLNELIGMDNNQSLFRYVFKWFGNEPEHSKNEIIIGIVSDKNNNNNKYTTGQIGDKIGNFSGSIGWYYGGYDENTGFSRIIENGKIIAETDSNEINLGLGGVKRELTSNEFEPNMYFLMEIDLIKNRVSFLGEAFEKNLQTFSIESISKPFQIGISMKSNNNNGIGIGIVKPLNSMNTKSDVFDFNSLETATNVKTHSIVRMPVSVRKKLKQAMLRVFKSNSQKSNIYGYNYYSFDQLANVLMHTNLILNYQISSHIINLITKYCGITDWDLIRKSRNVNIIKSKDTKVSYAVLTVANTILDENGLEESYSADTVLLNEWIGISEDKQIFRYLFKWFGTAPEVETKIRKLGIITQEYNTPLDQTVGNIGRCNHSACFYYDSRAIFQHQGNS